MTATAFAILLNLFLEAAPPASRPAVIVQADQVPVQVGPRQAPQVLDFHNVVIVNVGANQVFGLGSDGRPAGARERLEIVQEVVPVSDEEFALLIRQLNHPRFVVRAEAEQRLSKIRSSRLPALVEEYHACDSIEVKRRLRYVIEQVHYRKQVSGERGFLGIAPIPVHDIEDPTTGDKCDAVRVQQVIAGQAAEGAGVKVNDYIVEYGGESMGDIFKDPPKQEDLREAARQQGIPYRPSDPRIAAFTHRVKTTDPGELVKMRILRPKMKLADRVAVIGDEPDEFTDSFKYNIDRSGVLRIREVTAGGPVEQMGLKTGDVILAINGKQPQVAQADPIRQAVVLAGAGGKLTLSVPEEELVEVSIELRLGQRPMDMLNPEDEIRLRDNFREWWLAQGGDYIPAPTPAPNPWSQVRIFTDLPSDPVQVPLAP